MTETYTLLIAKCNPILKEPEFVTWLKHNGHLVSLTNDRFSSLNGISDANNDWVKEVFCELLDAFEETAGESP